MTIDYNALWEEEEASLGQLRLAAEARGRRLLLELHASLGEGEATATLSHDGRHVTRLRREGLDEDEADLAYKALELIDPEGTAWAAHWEPDYDWKDENHWVADIAVLQLADRQGRRVTVGISATAELAPTTATTR